MREPSARKNERREHASQASLNRLRGVKNERVGNARVNKPTREEAERRRRAAASSAVRSGR